MVTDAGGSFQERIYVRIRINSNVTANPKVIQILVIVTFMEDGGAGLKWDRFECAFVRKQWSLSAFWFDRISSQG